MSILGFGNRKRVYLSKPRKPFVQIKALFEDELFSSHEHSTKYKESFTKEEVEAAKKKIRARYKKLRQRQMVLKVLVYGVLILSAYFILK